MANIHRINDYSNNNNRNFQVQNNQENDIENEPGYMNIPFISSFFIDNNIPKR